MTPLIEATTLPEYGLTVGLDRLPGAGWRVATHDMESHERRHMSASAARCLARELDESEEGPALAPVAAALRHTAQRLETALSQPLGNA